MCITLIISVIRTLIPVTRTAEDREMGEGRERGGARGGAYQRLEVLGQLGAAGVTRVHRDEDAARRVELDLAPLEHEGVYALRDGREDAQDLLRDDREHLDLDAVELVKARPRSGTGPE